MDKQDRQFRQFVAAIIHTSIYIDERIKYLKIKENGYNIRMLIVWFYEKYSVQYSKYSDRF